MLSHGRPRGAWIAGAALLIATGVARAQTLSNPDLSAIGDMRALYRPDASASGVGSNNFSFEFEELELAVNAYLNPYMRADVFLGIHGTGPEIEIEEAVMTVLRGLPAALQFSAGQYLLDFGKINSQHPHQWAWLERPLMHRTMLGEEGLRALGARLTTLVPVGETALGVSASAFSSSAFEAHEHEKEEEAEAPPEIMGSARVSLFRQFSDATSAELGVSYLAGDYDPVEPLATQIAAVDWKLRWRPDSYRALVWVAEAMSSQRDVAVDSVTVTDVDAFGAFTSAELQFRKRWSAGAFFDWTQDASIQDAETTAAGAFFAFLPVEETARISLVYRHETSDLYTFTDNSVTLQFLWSLGPHRVHTF